MQAEREEVEVECAVVGDDDLAVEDAALGELGAERVEEVGEVAIEWLGVAALEVDVVAVAEDESAEAVPLGLEAPVAGGGDGVDALGEHGEERRREGERHGVRTLAGRFRASGGSTDCRLTGGWSWRGIVQELIAGLSTAPRSGREDTSRGNG